MDDAEFIAKLKSKIETATGISITMEIDHKDKRRLAVDLATPEPRVIFGADAIEHAGLARMFSQYAILCLRERREVGQEDFLAYLRRN